MLSSGAVCLRLILLALYKVPHNVDVLSSARNARTSTAGARSKDPVVHNRLQKVLHATLAPFLFGNSLINHLPLLF